MVHFFPLVTYPQNGKSYKSLAYYIENSVRNIMKIIIISKNINVPHTKTENTHFGTLWPFVSVVGFQSKKDHNINFVKEYEHSYKVCPIGPVVLERKIKM